MGFSSAVRYKITEKSIEKETRIANQYMTARGKSVRASAHDSLSWNYIHAINLLKE